MDGGSSVFAGAKNCPFILNIKSHQQFTADGFFVLVVTEYNK